MSIMPDVERTERPDRIAVRKQTAIMQILCFIIVATVSKITENQHRVM